MSLILHCLQAMRRFRSFSHLFHCDLEQFILARDVKKKAVCLHFSYHELGKRASIYCYLLYLPGEATYISCLAGQAGSSQLVVGPPPRCNMQFDGPDGQDRNQPSLCCVVFPNYIALGAPTSGKSRHIWVRALHMKTIP